MYCRNCGEEVNDNAVVCVHCGVATGINPMAKVGGGGLGMAHLVLGYLASVFIPIIGLVVGLASLRKDRDHGIGMIVVSIIATVVWASARQF